MFKKVLTLMLVLVGVLAMAGCKPGGDTPPDDELTTLEKISEAMAQLDLPSSASSDLVLLTAGLHDVVISWESSNEDVIAENGTVTIPLFSDGDQTVTITAYLELDGEILTKTFDVEVLAATVMTDAEKAHEAAIAFNGLISGNIIADVTLPLTGQHDSTVTWASSHPEIVAVDGTVVRPAEGEDNVTVTLTATVTVGTATEDVALVFTVVADESATVYTSIADLYATAVIDDYIEFTGIVVHTFSGGYFLSDGTHSLGIYASSSDIEPEIGDEVKVKGFYAVYNTLYQLGYPTLQEVLSSGNANPLTPEVKTVAEIIALDSTDKTIHGMPFTVSGTLQKIEDGGYTNTWLVDGDDKIQIYHYSNSDSLDVLEGYIDVDVTLTGTYYTFYKGAKVYFSFDGGVDDVVANLSPQEAFDGDISVLEGNFPIVSLGDVVLPTMGNNGTTFGNWTSSNTAIYSDAGVFNAIGTVTETVTFTGTATAGDLTQTVTIDVVVPVLSTVAEVLAMEIDDFFQVSGTVYGQYSGGFFIEQGGDYIFVYSYDISSVVVEGDNITLLGQLGSYNGLIQVYPESAATVNSQGNTPNVAEVTGTVGDLLNDTYLRGTKVTVIGMVSIEGDNSNAYITDVAGNKVEVYYKSDANVIKGFDGQVISVELIMYTGMRVLFYGVAEDVTAGAVYTDLYTANAVAAAIDLGMLDNVNMNLTLPGDSTDPLATITWTTSDAAVVTDMGVITMVSGSTPSATLTATVTVGVEVVTRDFVVTLMDLDDNVALSVTDALLVADGNTILVTGIIIGEFYGERVIQDPVTGATLWIDSDIYGDLGDEIVVLGTLATYTSNGNNSRQLDSATKISTGTTGNPIITNPETDVANIKANFHLNQRYTATLTLTVLDDGFGYALFNTVDVAGNQEQGFKFKPSDFAPYLGDVYIVGDTIEITFIPLYNTFENVRIINVEMPALTDAQAMTAAQAGLEVNGTTTVDLTLPTEMYGVAISWVSDNAAITDAGVVTRPAVGAGDATVTLTATLTIGSETAVDIPFTVVVPEETPPAMTIFISEYIEGGSNNKAIELYNPNDFDLTLTGYVLYRYNNGSTDASVAIDLSGITIPANGTYVFANSGSIQAILDVADTIEGSSTYFNGDDALVIELDGVVVDIIGVVGEDPGSGWDIVGDDNATANHTLVRNPDVTTGVTVFDPSQWTVYPQDTTDYLGSHTVN